MKTATQIKREESCLGQTKDVTQFLFDDHEIRAFEDDGTIWLVADDLAKVLGYSQADRLTVILDDDEKGPHTVRTPGGPQSMLTVSESGCYHAIFKSRKPGAKKFRRWITEQVIPEIRRTGKYNSQGQGDTEKSGFIESMKIFLGNLALADAEIVGMRRMAVKMIEESVDAFATTGVAMPQAGEENRKRITEFFRSSIQFRDLYESAVDITDNWEKVESLIGKTEN